MPALHTLFLDAVAEERERKVSRRTLFGTGSKLAVGGAAALVAAASPAFARLLAAQEFTSDIDVLNYALTLEHLEYAFYRDGLALFTPDNFEAGVFDNLILVRDHEGAHVDALVSTINSLGGTPVQEAVYDFGYANADGFLSVAAALENTGVSAYDGAASSIENVDLLNAAGSIVAVEARHASYLNLVNGEDPFPSAFETPLSRAEVLDIAGPFIVTG
jgi:rubrerythrin